LPHVMPLHGPGGGAQPKAPLQIKPLGQQMLPRGVAQQVPEQHGPPPEQSAKSGRHDGVVVVLVVVLVVVVGDEQV
jgi:hypothetical protein